jgi:amylosucrase
VYKHPFNQHLDKSLKEAHIDSDGINVQFYGRLQTHADQLAQLFTSIYGDHPQSEKLYSELIGLLLKAHFERSVRLKNKDREKSESGYWFLSNQIAGMSLYVDRFCGNLPTLRSKLPYFENLGVNLLHLMPLFKSPAEESDGGYAVSNFREVDEKLGNLEDLFALQKEMDAKGMYLMLDIVLNHTSREHDWALRAKQGEQRYQDYFHMFDDRRIPDDYEKSTPEIFPESSPGNFTYVPECGKWVMTVFHDYQWDLNYRNPLVFLEMLDTIFFYANLGVDVLRVDGPAFIWKQPGTTCINLPRAHSILRLIKQCLLIATPGMALLGEAIVAPSEILKYFGTGAYTAKECDFAYNATHMALQWDMLATADTRIMLAAQSELLQKPYGTTWLTYARCHDDIGLGHDDSMISEPGFDPNAHRKFLKDYYSGKYPGSTAMGLLSSSNPKTGDARISGSLASLCGLEKAIIDKDGPAAEIAIRKILLMQAHCFFLGGIPMIFYGDEVGYTNDYSYLNDPGKSYDNRWMHRPFIDWDKNKLTEKTGTMENEIFLGTKKLLNIRKKLPSVGDYKNLIWLKPYNIHIAGYLRTIADHAFFAVFNFSNKPSNLTWAAFKEHAIMPATLYDHWTGKIFSAGNNEEYITIEPYGFHLLTIPNPVANQAQLDVLRKRSSCVFLFQ